MALKIRLKKEATTVPPIFANGTEEYNFFAVAEDVAKSKNCTVLYPKDNELQLDIDTDEQYQRFLRRFKEVKEMFLEFNNITYDTLKSKSGNKHIIVYLPKNVIEWQRIALQFMFGSDPIRETLNIYRIFKGTEKPTRLFRPIEE